MWKCGSAVAAPPLAVHYSVSKGRPSGSTRDIKYLIVSSNGQLKERVEMVGKAGMALREIVDSIKGVADLLANTATASTEQSVGIEQINGTLTQMDEMTQQNSGKFEENAARARALEHHAQAMNGDVVCFRLGNARGRRNRPPPGRLVLGVGQVAGSIGGRLPLRQVIRYCGAARRA